MATPSEPSFNVNQVVNFSRLIVKGVNPSNTKQNFELKPNEKNEVGKKSEYIGDFLIPMKKKDFKASTITLGDRNLTIYEENNKIYVNNMLAYTNAKPQRMFLTMFISAGNNPKVVRIFFREQIAKTQVVAGAKAVMKFHD